MIPEALRAAAGRFGTPVYVTSAAILDDAAAELRDAFPDPWLRAYSVKANDVPAIIARLGAAGLAANVVSSGEWAAARRASKFRGAQTQPDCALRHSLRRSGRSGSRPRSAGRTRA